MPRPRPCSTSPWRTPGSANWMALSTARPGPDHRAGRPLGQTACALLADYHAAVRARRARATTRRRGGPAARRQGDRTWNFASRLDDVAALEAALAADPDDATAAALLGHWCYAHDRADEAIEHWRRSAELDPDDPVVWRNLAVARVQPRARSGGGHGGVRARPRRRPRRRRSSCSRATSCSSASGAAGRAAARPGSRGRPAGR